MVGATSSDTPTTTPAMRHKSAWCHMAAIVIAACLTALPGMPCLAQPDLVRFDTQLATNTIVVRTGQRRLYLVLGYDLVSGHGVALRYRVGVGRVARQWTGQSSIAAKFIRPNWAPPAIIRRDHPRLPALISGDSPANPLGAAALTLAGGDYAIHGTNTPASIGGFVSYGCIRMYNEDILDLYQRVPLGAGVIVRD